MMMYTLLFYFFFKSRLYGNGMRRPFLFQQPRKKAHHYLELTQPSRLTMFSRGINLKRMVFYTFALLIFIMLYQIWNRPCHSSPFGGQVYSSVFCRIFAHSLLLYFFLHTLLTIPVALCANSISSTSFSLLR